MPSDEFIAHRKGPDAHLKEIGWERYYGTTASGYMPEFKATSNPCGVDVGALNPQIVNQLGITGASFRFYHIKCAYSTESDANQYVDRNPLSPTYGQMIYLDPGDLAAHTVTSGIMIKHNKGSKYGWLCVEDDCPYYQDTGRRYFYY